MKDDFEVEFDDDVFEMEMDLDDTAFDMGNSQPKKKPKGQRYKKPKYTKSKNVKYRYAVDAVKELSSAILDKEEIMMLLDGSFIFGDFIEAFLVENNLLCKNLIISTLGMSKDNVDSLNNLLVGGFLENLTIHVSDYYYAHNKGNAKYIYEKLDINDSFQLVVSSNHTKVVLMELEEQSVCFHGSANLRSSDCIEQMAITPNQDIFNMFKENLLEIEEIYYTIKKSVRNKDLTKIFKK